LTWKLKGTKFSRLLFQLQPKTHRTEEIGAGLLLKTPCSADAYTENLSKKEQKFGNSGTLAQEVQSGFIYQRGMLPTPTVMDSTNATATMKSTQVKEGSMHSVTLARAMTMGMLPTPATRDYKGANSMEHLRGENGNKMTHESQLPNYIKLQTGSNSQLNPRFVAEMMGFPPNWTELPFQSGEQNQSKDMETQ
jgi:hypothetical protein